jgi:hypothetical protein
MSIANSDATELIPQSSYACVSENVEMAYAAESASLYVNVAIVVPFGVFRLSDALVGTVIPNTGALSFTSRILMITVTFVDSGGVAESVAVTMRV